MKMPLIFTISIYFAVHPQSLISCRSTILLLNNCNFLFSRFQTKQKITGSLHFLAIYRAGEKLFFSFLMNKFLSPLFTTYLPPCAFYTNTVAPCTLTLAHPHQGNNTANISVFTYMWWMCACVCACV